MDITNRTAMPFAFALMDGQTLRSVGEASAFFSALSHDHRDRPHWRVAIRMFAHTMKEPAYLKAATMSHQQFLSPPSMPRRKPAHRGSASMRRGKERQVKGIQAHQPCCQRDLLRRIKTRSNQISLMRVLLLLPRLGRI